jgi:hypothetical protein
MIFSSTGLPDAPPGLSIEEGDTSELLLYISRLLVRRS